MDKVALLKAHMQAFRDMLALEAEEDWSLSRMLDELIPLFEAVDAGRLVPPCPGRFRVPFLIEDPRYGLGSALFRAAAEFECALEDAASQAWYRRAFEEDAPRDPQQ